MGDGEVAAGDKDGPELRLLGTFGEVVLRDPALVNFPFSSHTGPHCGQRPQPRYSLRRRRHHFLPETWLSAFAHSELCQRVMSRGMLALPWIAQGHSRVRGGPWNEIEEGRLG